ncbi:MAG: M20 family metallopeptidase [Halodesulfurarchaeum sp.]
MARDTHEHDRVTAHLDGEDERLRTVTTDLLGFDTQNPPGETAEAIDWLESHLSDAGIATDRVVADPSKPNLLATLPGRTDRTLLLNAHLDTVTFDPAAWDHDPLGEDAGDRIYGRGATDMKGPLAAMVNVLQSFARTGVEPPVDITLAVVGDEEVPGDAGVSALVEEESFSGDGCVIGETTSVPGRHSVSVADRGSIWLTLGADGRAAHGSRPMAGANAIDRLCAAVGDVRSALEERRLESDPAMDEIVEQSIEFYSQSMPEADAERLFRCPTVNLGRVEGGESINTVPESATARIDIRFVAGISPESLLTEIREALQDHPSVSIAEVTSSQGTFEAADGRIVDATAEAAESVLDTRIYRRSATGGGDAKTLRRAGIPTVEFAVGSDTAHGIDEYITMDALRANARIFTQLPYRFAEFDIEEGSEAIDPPNKG